MGAMYIKKVNGKETRLGTTWDDPLLKRQVQSRHKRGATSSWLLKSTPFDEIKHLKWVWTKKDNS